jgi:plastocyanin
MKKIYSLIFASAFALLSFNSTAATVNIIVGFNGAALANEFFPSAATAFVGDVITFTNAGGSHNVTSTSVPAGAAAMMSPTLTAAGQTYNYTVTVAGSYAYTCTFHAGMNGTIAVTASTGIITPAVDLLTNAYPNPFKDKMTIKYNGIESVELFNVIGEKVKTFELSATENKIEIDLTDLTAGIYFYRTYKEGVIVETKKIVKSK